MKPLAAFSIIGVVATFCLTSTTPLRAAEHDDKAHGAVDVQHIPSDQLGMDIGPNTVAAVREALNEANREPFTG